MSDRRSKTEIGIGATEGLSLRVSVAALARVVFKNPENGETMLALEQRATVDKAATGQRVPVKSQPFGGALRIHDLMPLQNLIRDFHFDSEHSYSEQDFRLFIYPSEWKILQQFCLQHFAVVDDPVLESDPWRELEEEITESLNIRLSRDQFSYRLAGTVVEDHPLPTENIRARGFSTARIYRIFEAEVLDPALATALRINSERYSVHDLQALALEDAHNGGLGMANKVLTLPLKQLISFYSTLSSEMRNTPVSFQNHILDETVAAVLDLDVPKFQKV